MHLLHFAKKQKTEYHRVAIFNDGLVGIVERYVKKGSKLYIEGKLQTRSWEDRDGNKKYATEVVLQGYGGTLTLLDSKQGGGQGNQSHNQSNASGGGYGQTNDHSGGMDDDDIPFWCLFTSPY